MNGRNSGCKTEQHTMTNASNAVAIEASRLGEGQYASYSAPAPYKITAENGINEDALLVKATEGQPLLLSVADGAGGHPVGHEASQLLMQCLATAASVSHSETDSLREPILSALDTCNQTLLQRGRGSLTTAAIVEIHDNAIRPYHVGDSTIMVVGQRGRIKYQSISHSTVGYGIEAGLMDADAAHLHEERHWVLNFVGAADMRIELGAQLSLARYDTLIICSDAITDNLAIEEVCELIRKGSLSDAMGKLIARCQDVMNTSDGRPDDLSVILYRRGH